MTRTYVNKSGDTWEWEEDEEVNQALLYYWGLVNQNKQEGLT